MYQLTAWISAASVLVLLLACLANVSLATIPPGFQPDTTKYNIDLRFMTEVTDEIREIFETARSRWESVIVNDLDTLVQVRQGQNICGMAAPEREVVDDLLVYVYVGSIDGVGNVLARAGPCAVDSENRIRVGIMQFDIADLERLTLTNRSQATVLHEMGHVLGFGTLWRQRGLVGESDDHELEDYELRYLGEQGNVGNQEVGMEYEAVVEDSGGEGTAGSHWEEDIYESELMTGFIPENGVAPMSLLTIRSMADLGYTVNTTFADNYTVRPEIVEGLDWDDLKEGASLKSSKKRLRINKDAAQERKARKEKYGNDVINVKVVTLDGEKKVR